jgi:DNA repair exonuclease SbcCD ATPase subunit
MNDEDDIIAELEARLAAREAELDAIRARADEAADTASADARATFEELDRQRADLRARMEAAKSARGPDWERSRESVDSAWSQFDAAINAAHRRFGRDR